MASWSYNAKATKSSLATTLDSLTIASATSLDAPALTPDATATAYFNAAVAQAEAALTALSGPAPFARVQIDIYEDTAAAAPIPAASASRIAVVVTEFWN